MSDTVIQLKDLPLRPRKLTDDDLEGVFGGCKASGKKCGSSKDCCNNKKCGAYEWNVADSALNIPSLSAVEGGWKVKTASKICGF